MMVMGGVARYGTSNRSFTTRTDKEELTLNWKRVYKENANNFTLGEGGREAKYYTKGLCVRYPEHPECSGLHEVAEQYLKELTEILFCQSTCFLNRQLYFQNTTLEK